MTKTMLKGVMTMLLVLGLLATAAAPSALAKDKKKCRERDRGNYTTAYYDDDDRYDERDSRRRRDRDYDDNDYRRDRRDYDNDNDYRRDRRNSTGKTVRDVGVGAAIGAVGGALIGGKKGALIGAAVGAGGGYVYNKGKNRNRY